MNTLIDSMIEVDDIPTHRGNAVNHKGDCIRCKSPFGNRDKCRECGVGRDRIIQRVRRRRKATGKRGRNSGTVGTAKQKKS